MVRRPILALAALYLGALAIIVAYCTSARAETPAPRLAQIDRNAVLILIRTALIALDQANKTANYTVLHELGAPAFQVNSPERLAEIFAKQRSDHLDLSGVVAIEPQLTVLPQIEANGLMRMAGFFPSVPQQVSFDLLYAPVNGQWRLFGISVQIGSAVPAAPNPAAAPSPPAGKSPGPSASQKPPSTTAAKR